MKPMTHHQGTTEAPPRLFSPPANAMDITQLPRVPATTASAGPFGAALATSRQTASINDASVAMTNWNSTAPSAGSASGSTRPAVVGTPIVVQSGGYGYEKDYSWLKGKLDYSATARRWKLRYIPRDVSEHRIDDFGGSVILVDAGQLTGFSSGEFVRVEGRLGGRDASVRGFAPTYQVARIQRQSS
jgi:hypothetical protein